MLLTILAFLLVFFIITIVHEGGHLLAAKRAGIRVHEFGIGFGPTIAAIKVNETIYRLNLFPILGYVKIAGIDIEEPAEKETPENDKYYNKRPWDKFKAIFAGPFSNLLLGMAVFITIFFLAGIPTGISNEIASINPSSPAAVVGLQPGDKLQSIGGKTYRNMEEAIRFIHKNAGKEIALSVLRNGKTIIVKTAPRYHKRLKVGLLGFSLKPVYKRVNPLEAVYQGISATIGLVVVTLALLGQLIVGRLSFSDLAGPVGIAQITGQYAQNGLLSLSNFIAFFSINVAVLNLLPIPALDGGRLFFVILEAIRRKAIPIQKENKIHYVGIIILLSLMALLTVNDILRILRH